MYLEFLLHRQWFALNWIDGVQGQNPWAFFPLITKSVLLRITRSCSSSDDCYPPFWNSSAASSDLFRMVGSKMAHKQHPTAPNEQHPSRPPGASVRSAFDGRTRHGWRRWGKPSPSHELLLAKAAWRVEGRKCLSIARRASSLSAELFSFMLVAGFMSAICGSPWISGISVVHTTAFACSWVETLLFHPQTNSWTLSCDTS